MSAFLPAFDFVDDVMAAVLRQKSEVERLRMGFRMWKSARVILRAAIEADHPDWNEARVNREIACRISHGVVKNEPL